MHMGRNRGKVRDVTKMKLFRFGVSLVAVWVILGVWAGFAGGLNPAGDSLSLLRMIGGGVCVMLMLVMHGTVWRIQLGLTAIAAFLTTAPLLVGGTPGGTLSLYSKNIWFGNRDLAALATDIADSGAEVVTLQEVSERTEGLLNMLAIHYPHQHLCPFSGWGGVAVLSKHPITDRKCTARRALAAARINKDGQAVWIGSVHLPWPFPYANMDAAMAAEAVINTLDGPVVLAGDFNIFPWAASVGQLQRAADIQAVQPIRPTFHLKGLPLFLDHVHAPGGGQVNYRPLLGSDHLGVLADVRLTK